jgi:cytochrome c556
MKMLTRHAPMTPFRRCTFHLRGRLAITIVCAGLAIALLATSPAAIAQDQRAATAKDVIFARKTLMDFMCDKMADIERMIAMGHIDIDGARGNADAVSAMLMAFPHLFPPGSNQWDPDNPDPDPVTDTYASPEIWTKFPDFYRLATAAARSAHDLSRAATINDFKTHARELRITCDTCHALYSENN